MKICLGTWLFVAGRMGGIGREGRDGRIGWNRWVLVLLTMVGASAVGASAVGVSAVGVSAVGTSAVGASASHLSHLSHLSWRHITRLDSPPRMLPLGIGSAVAASETGVLAVGGGQDSDIGVDAGAVALWQFTANGVRASETITHPKDHRTAAFGHALAIDAQAQILCIGAPNEDGPGGWPENFQVGCLYIYVQAVAAPHPPHPPHPPHAPSPNWQLSAALRPTQPNAGAHFGSVIATDGTRIVVGSPDDNLRGSSSGRVDVFARRGDDWTLERELVPPNGGAGMRFGTSIAIDGSTIVVGSPSFSGIGYGSGRADVFHLGKDGWIHLTRLDAPSPQSTAWFGMSVAITPRMISIGAPRENPAQSAGFPAHPGVVHFFTRHGDDISASWTHAYCLTSPEPWCGTAQYRPEAFGMSLAMRGDLLAVGASESCNPDAADDKHPEGEGSGAVYLFQRIDDAEMSWLFNARMTAPDAAVDAHDGYKIALGRAASTVGHRHTDDAVLLVARGGNPDLSPDGGAAHLYAPPLETPQATLTLPPTLPPTLTPPPLSTPTTPLSLSIDNIETIDNHAPLGRILAANEFALDKTGLRMVSGEFDAKLSHASAGGIVAVEKLRKVEMIEQCRSLLCDGWRGWFATSHHLACLSKNPRIADTSARNTHAADTALIKHGKYVLHRPHIP